MSRGTFKNVRVLLVCKSTKAVSKFNKDLRFNYFWNIVLLMCFANAFERFLDCKTTWIHSFKSDSEMVLPYYINSLICTQFTNQFGLVFPLIVYWCCGFFFLQLTVKKLRLRKSRKLPKLLILNQLLNNTCLIILNFPLFSTLIPTFKFLLF